MIKDLMGKLHIQDSIPGEIPAAPPAPMPAPQAPSIVRQVEHQHTKIESKLGGKPMEDGIIIDLGDGISLNVPIKKRMSLHAFLHVAEKIKALELLAEEEKKNYT